MVYPFFSLEFVGGEGTKLEPVDVIAVAFWEGKYQGVMEDYFSH